MRRGSIFIAGRKNVVVKLKRRVIGKARVAGHDRQGSAAQVIKIGYRILRINVVDAAL